MEMGFWFFDQKYLDSLIFLCKQKKLTRHGQEVVGTEARFTGSIKIDIQFLKQLAKTGFLRSPGPTYADGAPNAFLTERKILQMFIDFSPNTANPLVLLK
jgi:hypothetical protein